jgi:hypothetical protein
MELIIGDSFENIKCESFKDPETSRIRVRPLPNQGLSTELFIECSKLERERYPLGTKFITIEVKVCTKPDGRIYLRAKDQQIERI